MNNEIINITFVGSARKNASKCDDIAFKRDLSGRVLMAAGVASDGCNNRLDGLPCQTWSQWA